MPLAGRLIQIKSDKTRQQSDVINATLRACLPAKSAMAAPNSGSTVRSVRIGKPLATAVVIFAHGRLLKKENDGQSNDGHGQNAQVILHATALQARQQAAACRENLLACFVRSRRRPS